MREKNLRIRFEKEKLKLIPYKINKN